MSIALALIGRYWPALAVLAVVFGAYQTGVNTERNRGEAAALRVQVQTLQRDAAIAAAAMARITADSAELEALRRADGEKIDQLQDIIRNRADPGLTQSELDGLLNIR